MEKPWQAVYRVTLLVVCAYPEENPGKNPVRALEHIVILLAVIIVIYPKYSFDHVCLRARLWTLGICEGRPAVGTHGGISAGNPST